MYGALMQPTGKRMRWCFVFAVNSRSPKVEPILFLKLYTRHINAFLFLFIYHGHIILTISLLIVHCLLVLMQILW
jgi:hypothetical protein